MPNWNEATNFIAIWLGIDPNSPFWRLAVSLVAVVASLATISRAFVAVANWKLSRRNARTALELQKAAGVNSFSDQEIEQAIKNYVEPDCASVDPADESDMRHVIAAREPVTETVDRVLSDRTKTHLMVLADSGMGKTTFLLNYLAKEQRRKPKRRRRMAIVPLARAEALDQIKSVQDKRDTFLLLDALDEDVAAIKDYESRLVEIMTAAADFKGVVLTCRTQFFASDASIPHATGIVKVVPRRAGATGVHEFRRFYLMPFTERQVEKYITKLVPPWQPFQRKRARRVVQRIPELTVRPMLLALLPELLNDKHELHELWDLYTFMVDKWLERESPWINPPELLAISERIAVDMVSEREDRGSERMAPSELAELLETSSAKVESWKLTQRSLLNRDAVGHFKFAHRSVMEFLFIKAFIGGRDECASVRWTDMMCDLFLSLGRTGDTTPERMNAIMTMDLARTGLFPLKFADPQERQIDAQWAKESLDPRRSTKDHAEIPRGWRHLTARKAARDGVVRVFELAEGLLWQYVPTRSMTERHDRELYRVTRYERQWQDHQERAWKLPTLSEFKSLVESLQVLGAFDLDDRELYWLADEDRSYASVASLRRGKQQEQLANVGELLLSQSIGEGDSGVFLDVYRVLKISHSQGSEPNAKALQAQPIMTYRGDVQEFYRIARDEADGWGLNATAADKVGELAISAAERRRRLLVAGKWPY